MSCSSTGAHVRRAAEVLAGASLLCADLSLASCSGTIGDPGEAGPPAGGAGSAGLDPTSPLDPTGPSTDPTMPADPTGRDPDAAGYGDDAAGLADSPAPATRVARLTHTQWENTIQDLFYLDGSTTFSDSLRPDPQQSGFIFENDTATLLVDEALWSGYQRATIDVVLHVTGDAARYAKILPADTGDATARAREFVDTFGLRAYRRPLTSAEVDEYMALYAMGPTLYTGLTDFDAGIRLVLEVMLQSPHFLYRVETSETPDGDVIPLTSYEVASRLSYLIWNTMPDPMLFAAAAADELKLADQAGTHAERMLEDPRAEEVVEDFHSQLLEIEEYRELNPSPAFFPSVAAELGDYAVEEAERFVRHIFTADLGYRDFLTSNDTFVNAELAGIYGLSGSYGAQFVAATLDAAERRGFFTQVGFLAANSSSVDPDPIHRGVFLAKRIACVAIAAPDVMTPPLPPPDGRTNRELTEDATEMDGTVCASCHKPLINPFGFPFENYDAIGQYRTMDSGFPVDAATTPLIGGVAVPVTNAIELADALAADQSVHECYAKHWVEFAYGRAESPEDDSLITRLAERSLAGTQSIKALIVGLVRTEAFMTRSVEELP